MKYRFIEPLDNERFDFRFGCTDPGKENGSGDSLSTLKAA